MNKLEGKIARIESCENMSLVNVEVDGDIFSSVVLETPLSSAYLKEGNRIAILFKETEVSIGKNLTGMLSIRNRFRSRIKSIEKAEILSRVVLEYKGRTIVSIITTGSVDRLDLKAGEEVEWLVKTNEVSLMPGDQDGL